MKAKSRPLGCAVLLLLPLTYYVAQLLTRTQPTGEAEIVAHRGGAGAAPENTLAAFRHAIAQGADAIELDVQMTKDGALVVIHDETVDRTTDGSGAVRDLTLEQIRELDAGNGEKVPTFEEVIALAKSGGVRVFPEAKSPHLYPGLEEKMLHALRDADYLEQATIQSFDANSLQRLRGLDSGVQLCALHRLWEFDLRSPAGDAQYVCPVAEMALLYPAMIRQAHSEGRRVVIWFLAVESPITINILRSFGADGFIVDDPAAARAALTN